MAACYSAVASTHLVWRGGGADDNAGHGGGALDPPAAPVHVRLLVQDQQRRPVSASLDALDHRAVGLGFHVLAVHLATLK